MQDPPWEEERAKCLEYESEEKGHAKADGAGSNGGAPRIGRIICPHCKGKDKAKDDCKGVEDVGKVILESPFKLPQWIRRAGVQ